MTLVCFLVATASWKHTIEWGSQCAAMATACCCPIDDTASTQLAHAHLSVLTFISLIVRRLLVSLSSPNRMAFMAPAVRGKY